MVEHVGAHLFFYKTTLAPSLTKKVRLGNAFLDRGGLGVVSVGLFNYFQGNLSFTRIAELCSFIDNQILKIGFLPNIQKQNNENTQHP
jgi:hypothetical protein